MTDTSRRNAIFKNGVTHGHGVGNSSDWAAHSGENRVRLVQGSWFSSTRSEYDAAGAAAAVELPANRRRAWLVHRGRREPDGRAVLVAGGYPAADRLADQRGRQPDPSADRGDPLLEEGLRWGHQGVHATL